MPTQYVLPAVLYSLPAPLAPLPVVPNSLRISISISVAASAAQPGTDGQTGDIPTEASAAQPGAIGQTSDTSEEATAAQPAATSVLHSLPPPLVKEMINHWRNDVRLWMDSQTQQQYFNLLEQGDRQQAHQFMRSRFSAYLFRMQMSTR